jgi:ankyrin repeat protein
LVSPRDIEFMRLLLTYGARPDTRDRAGLTPLMKAARLPDVSIQIEKLCHGKTLSYLGFRFFLRDRLYIISIINVETEKIGICLFLSINLNGR